MTKFLLLFLLQASVLLANPLVTPALSDSTKRTNAVMNDCGPVFAYDAAGNRISRITNTPCEPPQLCMPLNKVRLLWRTSDFQRLNGAKFQGSNDGVNWFDIYTVSVNATGSWQEFVMVNMTMTRMIRYVASPVGFGELREIEFYNGNQRLIGQPFGSELNVAGMEWENAIDGDVNTVWHGLYFGQGANIGQNNYVGYILNCGACMTPAVPTIAKIVGTTVCSPSQKVTLKATGTTGAIKWYKNNGSAGNVFVGEGQTFETDQPGNYFATCSERTCTSAASSNLTVLATSGCQGNFARFAADQSLEGNSNPSGLLVSPNPSNGQFDVSFLLEKGESGKIVVTDLQGKIWFEQEVIGEGRHKRTVTLKGVSSGLFLVQLKTTERIETSKVSIVR